MRKTREKKAGLILVALDRAYPEASCALRHRSPFELLVSTILSAQCTDSRVNQVTPALFRRCPGPRALAAIARDELEALIRPTGFFRNKAASLQGAARMLVQDFGEEVPRTMEELVRLPGVARKTANVVMGTAFGINEGIVVDTHVARLARRMGLSKAANPVRIEADLMALFHKSRWTDLGHLLIQHGRAVCSARKPACGACPLSDLCPKLGIEGRRPSSSQCPSGLSGREPPGLLT